MDYSAEITARKGADSIYKCISAESISRERSTLNLEKKGSTLVIKAEAKDATALRATLNAVMQIIAVCEKMEEASGKK